MNRRQFLRDNDCVLSGLHKDVVNLMPLDTVTVTVDFLADNPGNSLLHCLIIKT